MTYLHLGGVKAKAAKLVEDFDRVNFNAMTYDI